MIFINYDKSVDHKQLMYKINFPIFREVADESWRRWVFEPSVPPPIRSVRLLESNSFPIMDTYKC